MWYWMLTISFGYQMMVLDANNIVPVPDDGTG